MIASNLTASIQLVRVVVSHMRAAGCGRVTKVSRYGEQFAFPGNSMCHATKWGFEGFVGSADREVAPPGSG